MKKFRLERWSGIVLSPGTRPRCLRQLHLQNHHRRCGRILITNTRTISTTADVIFEDEPENDVQEDTPTLSTKNRFVPPSPPPEAALQSAKLHALHARLFLPKSLPLQTLARTLVDSSADSDPDFNNTHLALVGGKLISLHVAEYLMCKYPRLPLAVFYAATFAFSGPKTLHLVAQEWGVESAAAPGAEVDPGLLQYSKMSPGTPLPSSSNTRPDGKSWWRRGMASRVVYDDEFGDLLSKHNNVIQEQSTEAAYATFMRALTGAILLHAGRETAEKFVKAHLLSRHLNFESLFKFGHPLRDLSRLCAREDLQFPVARVLSETGRRSRSPVYVVGIYSGDAKLGEGAGASRQEARLRACAASLKAWYLYSPGHDTRVPSDMEAKGALPWTPVHVDIGEIVT